MVPAVDHKNARSSMSSLFGNDASAKATDYGKYIEMAKQVRACALTLGRCSDFGILKVVWRQMARSFTGSSFLFAHCVTSAGVTLS